MTGGTKTGRTEVCRRWRSNACITSGDGQVSRMIRTLLIRVIRGQILIFGERTQGRDWRATLRGCHTSDWTFSNYRCKRRSVVFCGHVACGSEPSTPLKQHIVLIRIANLCKTAVEFSCQGSDHLRTESCRGFLSGHQRLT